MSELSTDVVRHRREACTKAQGSVNNTYQQTATAGLAHPGSHRRSTAPRCPSPRARPAPTSGAATTRTAVEA